MAKFAKIVGSIVVTLAAVGFLANLKDVRRYVRMSTM
jgi:hypothetical protein